MSGGKYAEGTTVEPEKSQGEIMGLLRKYGATGFAYGWEGDTAAIQFVAHDRRVRFVLKLPTDARQFARTTGARPTTRTATQQQAALDQEVRRLWRCLALAIKAKLEVVSSGIASFEDEFLAHIVMPDGSSVGETVRPQIATAYEFNGSKTTVLQLGPGATR